ncbi:MAG: hypothetical protein R3F24_04335 [Gammaproteobacteria bacterium]
MTAAADNEAYVSDALAGSALVRLRGEPPRVRPSMTPGADGIGPVRYVDACMESRTASPPTDYDLIGSPADSTGIHALELVANVDLVCLLSGSPAC